jgi:ornithine carbamoyltransferase
VIKTANAADAQLGRGELIKDTARVLARLIHGTRSFGPMRRAISRNSRNFPARRRWNALMDDKHPCQILGDGQGR